MYARAKEKENPLFLCFSAGKAKKYLEKFGNKSRSLYLCIIKIKNQTHTTMKATEVRIVNAKQENGNVFFHLNDGKTIVRTMCAQEIATANRIRNTHGEEARIAEFVRLFNEKYSEPQNLTNVELDAEERRFFELHNIRNIYPLTPEEEDEYQRLLNND